MDMMFTTNKDQPLDGLSVLIHIYSDTGSEQAQIIYPYKGYIKSDLFNVGTVPEAIAVARKHTQSALAAAGAGSPCIWVYSAVPWDKDNWGPAPV